MFRSCRRRYTRKRRQSQACASTPCTTKIYREDILAHAYAQCYANKGAPGVDGRHRATSRLYRSLPFVRVSFRSGRVCICERQPQSAQVRSIRERIHREGVGLAAAGENGAASFCKAKALLSTLSTPMSRISTGHDWKDWHLTTEGWIPGNRRADIAEKRISAIPVPMGCVLTLRWHIFLPTENSAPASYYTRVLRGKSDAKVSELLKRYGEDPQKSG